MTTKRKTIIYVAIMWAIFGGALLIGIYQGYFS
jgi:hypothetical protein